MNKISKKIIVRYPPSPTGIAHIGNIRSFLFSHLVKEHAKKEGWLGEAVLRFEDTDRERSKKEFEEYILESLNDLNITYDRGPFRQSERTEFYVAAIETLLKNGDAFEAEESKDGSGDRVIRFKNPNKKVTFIDSIRGEITIDTTDFGDFVIARSKTNPLYHLTVVVDDIDMGITDVIRGEDHITSTPRQILLIEALGGIIPRYAHLPLIVGEDNKKLGKRHGAVSWQEFKKQGYLAQAVVNYLALLGWHPQNGEEKEIFSIEQLADIFRIEDVSKSPAKFDYQKLDDINKVWMIELYKNNREEYIKSVWHFLSEKMKKRFESEKEKTDKIISLVVVERLKKFSDIAVMEENGEFEYYFSVPEIEERDRNFKDTPTEETEEILAEIVKKIENISQENWKAEEIKKVLWDWSGEIGRGKVLHPMRFSLSGQQRSPDPFILAEILGKEETLKRLSK